MFSPAVADGGPATATRSRRRQRPKSQDSLVQQPKAKRQRLPLTEQTFVNPETEPEMVEAKSNKAAVVESRRESRSEASADNHPTPRKELNLRAKKSKHGDRSANKGDGSLVLTSTNAYTVSKLPALPDRIRSDWSGNQHAEVFASFGYALTLTPAHAIVWPYNSTSQSPETFTFTLPSASKPNDPLPVGCLVSPSASSIEPGLVVVMAGSGKVVYWESISSAATFAFIKKDRSGVEHLISGMSSGEKVTAITNAESAGFILTFNTGRLAYMNVRDSHGRPAISVQFLRSNLSTPSSGIFGSIRHAFSHLSLRGDVAAVRADRSARMGERNVVALSSKGKLQAWRVHRGGHHESIVDADTRDTIASALQEADPFCRDFSSDSLEALDFTFVPKGLEAKYLALSRLSDAMASDDPSVQHLLLLVSLTKKSVSRYNLVEVILKKDDCQVGMVRPITTYSAASLSTDSESASRPRIYLPRPALVAFVCFDRAAVIASIATPPESPDSQLRSDNDILPASFEDVVDFRDDMYEVIGAGFEEMAAVSHGQEDTRMLRHKSKNPAVVLIVRGAGAVRIVTTDVDKFASDEPPQVSAKTKLEQAVFFGIKPDNPLIFDSQQQNKFSQDETAAAALEVSHEILSSTTPYVATLPASLEDNLRARSNALKRLMQHLTTTNADLDRKTRWNLLFQAEKMHVAGLLWKRHETFTAARPASEKKSLIGDIVEFIHQDHKNNPVANIGEVDRVRHWFINDVFRLEIFVAWAYEVIKTLYQGKLLDTVKMTVLINEAVQINICSLVGARDFRKANLSFYGLGGENLSMGILYDGYDGLPEPWTGCYYVANNAKRLVDLCVMLLREDAASKEKPKMPDTVSMELPSLTDGMLTSLLELARWAQVAPGQKTLAQKFAEAYMEDRYDTPLFLASLCKWEDGARIAEKHGCLDGLAAILLDHIEDLENQLLQPGMAAMQVQNLKNLCEAKKTALEDKISKYKDSFAFPVYERLLEKHGVGAVLEFELDTLGFKTKFLRSKPELARISWINDVEKEKDVNHAAQTLVNLALEKEQQVWNKKIELSLGKLALLAEGERKSSDLGPFKVKADAARLEDQLKKVDRELISVKIQDQLYGQIFQSTYDAVDGAAALNFAMEAHSSNIPRRQKAILDLFQNGLDQLLKHEVLDAMTLIDLLTLVHLNPESRDELANPFWLALKVAESSCHGDEAKDAKRLIWRRVFVRDDWAKINDTQLKDDREVVLQLADTELYALLADCIRYQDDREPFRPMTPGQAAGVFIESLDHRCQALKEKEQSKILEAMNWEDKLLKQHMDKNRLAEWLRTTFDAAKVEVQSLAEEAAATTADAEAHQPASLFAAASNGMEPGAASVFDQP